jgi:hypothetical protein
MPLADIDGPQRKIVSVYVRPAKSNLGDSGIPVRGGRSLPFIVTRGWIAPAGNYPETWYLVDPETRAVLYESGTANRQIWGLQAVTEIEERVTEPLELAPGTYLVVAGLGGISGGEFEVEAVEVSAEQAA